MKGGRTGAGSRRAPPRQTGNPPDDVVYGVQPVRELLRGEAAVQRLVIGRGQRGPALRSIREQAHRLGVPISLGERADLDRLAGGGRHQGVVAVGAALPYARREEVLAAIAPPAFLVVLDRVEDPRNLGAVLRTAAAAGAHGVFLPARRAAGLGPAALKASAGTAGKIPVVREPNLVRLLELLKTRGIWTVAVEAGAPPAWQGFDLSLPVALVLGGEGRGIRPLVRGRCEAAVGLPLLKGVESLNVAVAFGILAYEVRRQRDRPSGEGGRRAAGKRAGREGQDMGR